MQYLNGATWTDLTLSTVLTPAQLASLRYVPPASGEDSGGTLSYSVSDGTHSVTGTENVTVIDDANGPNNLYFSAVGPGAFDPISSCSIQWRRDRGADSHEASAAFGSIAGEDGGYVQFANCLYFFAFTAATGDVLYRAAPRRPDHCGQRRQRRRLR